MRGRPKVILARTYEEAMTLYNKYKNEILGVITDVSFSRDGEKDKHAGIRLAKEIKEIDPYVPIIMESSETENAVYAKEMGISFLDKNSKKFPVDLGRIITDNFGFGDFVIRNPETGEEVMRITDLKEFQDNLFKIPDESLLYHASRNDISRWLYSRAQDEEQRSRCHFQEKPLRLLLQFRPHRPRLTWRQGTRPGFHRLYHKEISDMRQF